MTQVRQINRTRDAITVIDEMACETIVLTIIDEDCGIYAVQTDDAAYQLIPDGGDRWELSPQSVGSTFDGQDTRFVVAANGDGERWEDVVYVTIGEWGPGSGGSGHIVCDARDREAVQAAYDAIEDGDLSSYALSDVVAAGGEYVVD